MKTLKNLFSFLLVIAGIAVALGILSGLAAVFHIIIFAVMVVTCVVILGWLFWAMIKSMFK